jgi:hypothetical protein
MGLRIRKKISFGRLARVNLSRSGFSLGLGPRGFNVNLSPRGRKTTLGLPGTDVFWQTQRAWMGSERYIRTFAILGLLLLAFSFVFLLFFL